RGLIHDGRLAALEVRVSDRPGALAALTALVGEEGANILQLAHRRGAEGLLLTEVLVELTLETRGHEHVKTIVAALRGAGATGSARRAPWWPGRATWRVPGPAARETSRCASASSGATPSAACTAGRPSPARTSRSTTWSPA